MDRPLLLYVLSHCCSKRLRSLLLGLFVVLAILVPVLPFLFGRIMGINTFVRVRATDLSPCIF